MFCIDLWTMLVTDSTCTQWLTISGFFPPFSPPQERNCFGKSLCGVGCRHPMHHIPTATTVFPPTQTLKTMRFPLVQTSQFVCTIWLVQTNIVANIVANIGLLTPRLHCHTPSACYQIKTVQIMVLLSKIVKLCACFLFFLVGHNGKGFRNNK